jgi:hypothetical protein
MAPTANGGIPAQTTETAIPLVDPNAVVGDTEVRFGRRDPHAQMLNDPRADRTDSK